MKTSFVATVLNEESSILPFLTSLKDQTKRPDEIIIVDGGSTDNTLSIISNFKFPISNKKVIVKVYIKKGNRAVGRNYGINKAKGETIVISDAGCILDKNWVKNITGPLKDKSVEVVAGNIKGLPTTVFQKSLVPYVLVMQDKINPKSFLPATRSMAIRKSIWKKLGGFPKKFSHNEDYVFAKKLEKKNYTFSFVKDAIVYWIPRKNLMEAFIMFLRFAYGDAVARIIRVKVLFIFIRYVVGLALLFSFNKLGNSGVLLIILLLLLYVIWTIGKNYHYVKNIHALYLLPLLQFTSDLAVIFGTSIGIIKNVWDIKRRR